VALGILVLLPYRTILCGEQLDSVFQLLRMDFDAAAFLVPSMLNTLEFVMRSLRLVAKLHIEIFECLDLLFQRAFLSARRGELGICRLGFRQSRLIFPFRHATHHRHCAGHHHCCHPHRFHENLPFTQACFSPHRIECGMGADKWTTHLRILHIVYAKPGTLSTDLRACVRFNHRSGARIILSLRLTDRDHFVIMRKTLSRPPYAPT